MDKTNWKNIREALKDKDRYYKVYGEDKAESFWFTLDSKIVAGTFKFTGGIIIRVLYSIFGLSNRHEPMPIGNKDEINDLWKDKSDGLRYLLGKVRNPGEDFKKLYIGFAPAEDVKWKQVTTHFGFWLAKFKNIPFRIPFPYYKNETKYIDLMIGGKSRGILSITIRRP